MNTAGLRSVIDAAPDRMEGIPVVLVVEDEPLIRDMIATCLRDAGNNVIEASHAAQAVAVLTSGAPVDVVFTDIRMPGEMDGAMLARWIKRGFEGMPVILTSGTAMEKTGDAEYFFAKPYRPDEVVALVSRLLALKHGARRAERKRHAGALQAVR